MVFTRCLRPQGISRIIYEFYAYFMVNSNHKLPFLTEWLTKYAILHLYPGVEFPTRLKSTCNMDASVRLINGILYSFIQNYNENRESYKSLSAFIH